MIAAALALLHSPSDKDGWQGTCRHVRVYVLDPVTLRIGYIFCTLRETRK
jgi:hypothetical protein